VDLFCSWWNGAFDISLSRKTIYYSLLNLFCPSLSLYFWTGQSTFGTWSQIWPAVEGVDVLLTENRVLHVSYLMLMLAINTIINLRKYSPSY